MTQPPALLDAATRAAPVAALAPLQGRPAWVDESWAESTLRDDVRALLHLPAGPDLAAALACIPRGPSCPLPHLDDQWVSRPVPGHAPGWPCACQVVLAAAWEACAAWVAAGAARALVDAAGPVPVHFTVASGGHQLHDPARDELAPALRWTVGSAGSRIANARGLANAPGLLELVESATISAWAARLVCDHLDDLDRDQAGRVVAEVTTRVHSRLASGRRAYNSAEINQLARAARLRICPVTEAEARARAWAHRKVTVFQRPDGMATLIADLAEVDAHRIHRRLTALAASHEADAQAAGEAEPRTRDQLRADLMTDLLLGAALSQGGRPTPIAHADPAAQAASSSSGGTVASDGAADDVATRETPRPDIQVVVTLETLLGLAETPARVPGIGPLPADVARTLAAEGRWRAWVADASGAIAATGSDCYVPSAAVARLVRARDPHCRFPGCRQSAARCDLDHAIPWPRGRTTPQNLGALCRRHHNLKTHGGWHLDPNPPPDVGPAGTVPSGGGSTVRWRWTSAAGIRITDHPEPLLL